MRVKILIITLLFLGFCGSAWLNVQQHDQAAHDTKILRDQLASLKNQAAQMPDPSPDAGPSPSPDASSAPSVDGQSIVKVSLYGVKLTVADPLTDLVYGEVKSGYGSTSAGFTTEALLAQYPTCKAGALGTLVRTKASPTPTPKKTSPSPSPSAYPTKTPSTNLPYSKTVGGYTYTYKSPFFSCVSDQAGRNTVAAAIAALKNQALPTLVLQ